MYSVARHSLHLLKNTTTVMYSLVRAAEDRRDASLMRVVVYLTFHSPWLSCVTSRIVVNVLFSFHHKMDGEYVAQTMKGQKDHNTFTRVNSETLLPNSTHSTVLVSKHTYP